MLTRRAALTAIAGLVAAPAARAQTFPSRNISIVVPYPAGGPVDTVARLIAQAASGPLGQTIVVDNRGGGSGVIGSVAVARAEPDGHTLVLGTNQTHATNESLLKNCPYGAVKDFTPVGHLVDIPHVLVVRRGLEADSVAALVELAKKAPGKLNYGSTGNGSASHLAAELFKLKAGVDLQHIPFRGAVPMTTELLAGRIDATLTAISTAVPHIQAGKLRVLAVANEQRSPAYPDTPTFVESGLPSVVGYGWYGLMAPAGTPAAIVQRLNAETNAAIADAEVRKKAEAAGLQLRGGTAAEFRAFLDREARKWSQVIKAANIQPE
jgi:tripartite-type tricarboxylate transporter receptor subunit TctC